MSEIKVTIYRIWVCARTNSPKLFSGANAIKLLIYGPNCLNIYESKHKTRPKENYGITTKCNLDDTPLVWQPESIEHRRRETLERAQTAELWLYNKAN